MSTDRRARSLARARQGVTMRRFAVPFGFTLVAMWIVLVVMLVNSAHSPIQH